VTITQLAIIVWLLVSLGLLLPVAAALCVQSVESGRRMLVKLLKENPKLTLADAARQVTDKQEGGQ
jgi:heme exporter protein D